MNKRPTVRTPQERTVIMKNSKIYVVQTIVEGLDSDDNDYTVPGQIIGCFDDKKLAKSILEKVILKLPIKGINYDNIPDYVDVVILTFPLNATIKA